jgi:alkaline phosphatase D
MSAFRLNVPARSWNRRQVLKFGASAVAWPMLGAPESAFALSRFATPKNPFTLGVASGNPLPDGFVLWTRLAPDPFAEHGGMPGENVTVRWEVAADDSFKKVVAHGTAVAAPATAHAIHVEVPGLEPDRSYWYRFLAGDATSPVGRARTAPRPGDALERLRFAFASCQHWESGLFTAYQHMAAEDLDLVVHLGDYIYEYEGKEDRVRKHVGPEIESLSDYRTRHAQYKTDEHLQAAHALCPWLVTWDDHEFDNNCAGDISEQTHVKPADFLQRRAYAYQAYYEHMPLRAAQLPRGPHMKLYRHADFGGLVRFAVLDTRQYRTDQPNGDGNKPITPEALDPRATLMGKEQEAWFYATLKNSAARWNVAAQQVMMARADRTVGEKNAFSMDQWPGYEANRQRMLQFFAANPALNPVVLTGDIHSNWVNDLQVDETKRKSPVVATEFVGTSISSGGNAKPMEGTSPMVAENPFVRFHNTERGYVSCEVTPKRWTSHYRVTPEITLPGGPVVTRKTFVVDHGRPGAQEA